MLKVVHEEAESNATGGAVAGSLLDEIARDGARQMLAAALLAEGVAYVDEVEGRLTAWWSVMALPSRGRGPRWLAQCRCGHRGSTTNAPTTSLGSGGGFFSAILPAWSQKSPRVAEVLPLLYLHGLSSGDFGPALERFLGSGAGLSAATITRLTTQWQDEA